MSHTAKTARIARLNDALRLNPHQHGKLMITNGIQGFDVADLMNVLGMVAMYNTFDEDNDPYGEHDFGAFDYQSHKIFWKIDYYAPDMLHGSEDPSDPKKTQRVLTVMLASEY